MRYQILNGSRTVTSGSPYVTVCEPARGQDDPEIYFRIVHMAGNDRHSTPVAANHEQKVKIVLGHTGAFKTATWAPQGSGSGQTGPFASSRRPGAF